MTRTHDLKTWPEPFQAILDGRKRYEIRVDDRGFAVGDELLLLEYRPAETRENGLGVCFYSKGGYTDRRVRARVTYMTPGGAWGLPRDLCVLSIEVLQ